MSMTCMPTGVLPSNPIPYLHGRSAANGGGRFWYSDFDLRGGFCETQKYSCAVSFLRRRNCCVLSEYQRSGAESCRTFTSIHSKPGCGVDGSLCESLRRFLYIFVRQLDEEESHSRGSNCVERLRQVV